MILFALLLIITKKFITGFLFFVLFALSIIIAIGIKEEIAMYLKEKNILIQPKKLFTNWNELIYTNEEPAVIEITRKILVLDSIDSLQEYFTLNQTKQTKTDRQKHLHKQHKLFDKSIGCVIDEDE